MTGARQADRRDRPPQAGCLRGEDDRQSEQCAGEQRRLSCAVRGRPLRQQPRREPAARDRSDIGEHIHRDQRRSEIEHLHAVLPVEEIGQPEEEGPPHRIDQEPAEHVRPSLSQSQQRAPADRLGGGHRIGFDPGQFLRGDARVLARRAVESEPGDQPEHGQRAGRDERHPPAERHRDDRHDQRREDSADVRAGVEDADRERTLALRKPFVGCGKCGGERPGLADRERDAGEDHHAGAGEQCMRDVTDGPRRHRDRIADLRPHTVDEPAEQDIGDAVCGLERDREIGIALLAPVVACLEFGLEHRQDEPVDIAERDGGEQKRADDPPHLAARFLGRWSSGPVHQLHSVPSSRRATGR
jgi:hypothetical protein